LPRRRHHYSRRTPIISRARLQSSESSSINRHHPCGIRHATNSGLNKVVRLISLLAIVGMFAAILKHRASGQHRPLLFSLFFSFFSNYLAACRI
jgi:hypothetical protein